MNKTCENILAYLKSNLPLSFSNLNIGASRSELDEIEVIIQEDLPEEFRDLYSKFNGQKGGYGGLILGMEFLTLEKIEYFYKSWLRTLNSSILDLIGEQTSNHPDKIKSLYFHKGWVPFAYDGGGNFLAIDLSPEENGTKGQIICFGRDEDEKKLVSHSLNDMINQIFSRLNEEYSVSEIEDGEGNIITEFTFKSTGGNSFLDTLK